MKRILPLLLIVIMLTNCSSSDSDSETDNSDLGTFNFTLDNKVDFVRQEAVPSSWKKQSTTPTSKNIYDISTFVVPKGQSSDSEGYMYYISLSIETDGELQQNKVYNISEISISTMGKLPLTYSLEVGCNETDLYIEEGATTGQIKITSFDGKNLKGEFSFDKLTNDNGFGTGYCNGTPIPTKSLIVTKGIFHCIKE